MFIWNNVCLCVYLVGVPFKCNVIDALMGTEQFSMEAFDFLASFPWKEGFWFIFDFSSNCNQSTINWFCFLKNLLSPSHTFSLPPPLFSAELSEGKESEEELNRLAAFVAELRQKDQEARARREQKLKEQLTSGAAGDATEDDEAELCSICYADTMNTTFIPCRHRSCKRCIQRHKLQSDTCFFCKAKIESLEFDAQREWMNDRLLAASQRPW